MMEEKKKKKLEEATQSRSTDTIIDPPSLIRRHMKWKIIAQRKLAK